MSHIFVCQLGLNKVKEWSFITITSDCQQRNNFVEMTAPDELVVTMTTHAVLP